MGGPRKGILGGPMPEKQRLSVNGGGKRVGLDGTISLFSHQTLLSPQHSVMEITLL